MTFARSNAMCQAILVVAMIALLGVLGGCNTLSAPNPSKLIATQRTNIITHLSLSLGTQSVVLSSGHSEQECLQNFNACLQALNPVYSTSKSPASKQKLAVLAELHYAHALHLKTHPPCQLDLQRPPIDSYYSNAPLTISAKHAQTQTQQSCLAQYLSDLYSSLRYSYAYLFYDPLTGKQSASAIANIVSEEHIRTQDIYHVATRSLVNALYKNGDLARTQLSGTHKSPLTNHLPLLAGKIASRHPKLFLYLANNPSFASQGLKAVSELTSLYDSKLPRLAITSTLPGLGVGYVASLNGRYQANARAPSDPNASARIHPMGHLPITAVVIPWGKTLDELLASDRFDLYLLNPYDTDSIRLLGKTYPLFANFSAGYAKWISENAFRQIALKHLVAKGDAHLPELFMLEPFNPNKKVIIMLHGLASSPATWVQLTNSLLADPVLRDNYQVWQIFYATNLPILENRYQIQQLISTAFAQTDPTRVQPSSHHATIIAHSMGAVIARLMLSNDDLSAALSTPAKAPTADSKQLIGHASEFDGRLQLSALPQVDSAVFISAPFRGTDYANRWLGRTLSRVIHLPTNAAQDTSSPTRALYLQNGASQLSDQSAFIALTQNVAIAKGVRFHSIIANNSGNDTSEDAISDGIVPYHSSHLDNAASEVVITGNHRIHTSPQTILHLRQILHDKLGDAPHPTP